MTISLSRSRSLLLGCVAGAGLMIAASPASAMLYVLDFTTSSQTGQIYFNAPAYTTPGALPGGITSIWVPGSVVTTFGTIADNGVPEQVKSIVPINGFSNSFGKKNDNELQSFINSLHTIPPSSNLNTTWFDEGGFAVKLNDGTIIDIFTKPAVGHLAASFEVESFHTGYTAILGSVSANPRSGTFAILSVPGPMLAAGYLGLSGLALGAAALRLRKRFAAR